MIVRIKLPRGSRRPTLSGVGLIILSLTVTAVFAKRIAAGITQGHPPSVSTRQKRCPSSPFPSTAQWQSQVSPSATGNSKEIFTDRAREAGINFVYFNGMSGEHYYNEAFGAGAALFDYNNDGKLDMFIIQGDMLGPGKTLADALFPPQMPLPLKGRLYRNDLVVHADGTRTLKFTDVTEQSGINAQGYGMSVATGDYNNDGCVDLYITYFDHSQMWRNNCDGTFTDVTEMTGTNNPSWGICAAFLDYDRDGWLDLMVGNYLDYSLTSRQKCLNPSGAEDYCGPLSYAPEPNRLLHNRGDGSFEDVTAKSQIGREFYGAMGMTCADFNGDGWIDIFISDDSRPNQLWINQHDGTFKDEAMLAGCALNKDGAAHAYMGVDAGDFNNAGHEDIVVGGLKGEYSVLYLNDGKGWFEDHSFETGLAFPTMAYTGFGVGFLDYDNDGWLDIFIADGAVNTIESEAREGDRLPLRQPKLLFHNLGNGRVEDVSQRAGAVFSLPVVSRGVAFGDVDNDGGTDILVVNTNGPAQLLINNVGHKKHWLGLRMVGEKVNRDMLGTRVALFRPKGPTLWRRVHTDGSYASASDPRVLFGLGDSPDITKVRAYWTSGRVEEWTGLPTDRYTTLREGSGRTVR